MISISTLEAVINWIPRVTMKLKGQEELVNEISSLLYLTKMSGSRNKNSKNLML
jgi:hypothetical protein